MNKFFLIISLFLFGASTFIGGYLVSRKKLPENGRLALIENPLITERFDRVEEKYSKPTGPIKLGNDNAQFTTISPNGREVWYYLAKTGQIKSSPLLEPGKSSGSALIAELAPGLLAIAWSADKKELLARDSEGYFSYNIQSKIQKRLDSRIKKASFSPTVNNSNQISYLFFDPSMGLGAISVADSVVTSFRELLSTRTAAWRPDWLTSESLILSNTPEQGLGDSLFTLNIQTKALQKILSGLKQYKFLPSPDGRKVLYSSLDPISDGILLSFLDVSTATSATTGLSLPADRCVWSADSKTIYCSTKTGFITLGTDDPENYKTIKETSLADSVLPGSFLLSGSEDLLIFTDSPSGKLFALPLE